MTRVAKALTDYAFNELGLNKVDISAAAENKKSRSIPERLGFVNEGCIRQAEWLYDHYVDHIVYGMLAKDWNNK
jgi:ribosomal-protein-serine acetyltransferase